MLWSGRSGCLKVCFELKKRVSSTFHWEYRPKIISTTLRYFLASSSLSCIHVSHPAMDAYDISQQQHRLNNDNSDDEDDDDYGNYSNDGEDCENCGDNEDDDD